MSELDDVLAALAGPGAAGSALATIVGVRGSTYRREGARLVVPGDGAPTVGNISGGCLEGDVIANGVDVLAAGVPRLLHFDLTADDEAVWGWGLGCNGAIDVFVEPAANAAPFAEAMARAKAEQQPIALAMVVEGGRLGARRAVQADGSSDGSLGDPIVDVEVTAAALGALATGRSRTIETAGGARVFVEVLVPPPRLVVCGAGHDAIPLVELAARLGWRVEVVDDRAALLNGDRFPAASRLVVSAPLAAADAVGVGADRRTHAVVMSHNFLRDKDYLQSFLGRGLAYLGMLGPRARLDRLVAELRAEGVDVDGDDLANVFGPAGLDIGAEGPEQIAWAIVAEILAVDSGASGGHLRERSGPVHLMRPAASVAGVTTS